MRRRNKIFAGVFLGGVILMSFNVNSKSEAINWAKEKGRWSEKIDEQGAEAAYGEFKKAYEDENLIIQHWAVHLFGSLLYEKVGIQGTVICDDAFNFGCYHGFFSSILADKGDSIIAELDALCVGKYGIYGTGCQHGIGHGLIEFFGRDNLLKALEACRHTTQVNKRFGCTSGVFMEYNAPLLTGAEVKRDPKTLNTDEPYEPCDKVPQQYQESCYYELAQWWTQSGLDFQKIGELCGLIENLGINQRSCYFGIANLPVSLSGDPENEIPRRCGQMPDTLGEALCLAGYKLKNMVEKCEESSVERDMCSNGAVLDSVNKAIDIGELRML